MSLRVHEGRILLEGHCAAGDAELLLTTLQDLPGATVDIGGVQKLHMAVLQVLLALEPTVTGQPQSGAMSRDIFRRLISDSDSRRESS